MDVMLHGSLFLIGIRMYIDMNHYIEGALRINQLFYDPA